MTLKKAEIFLWIGNRCSGRAAKLSAYHAYKIDRIKWEDKWMRGPEGSTERPAPEKIS